MLLQDAVILGDTLKKSNYQVWLSEDGSCGCAFGGAILALGLSVGYMADRQAKYESQIYSLEPLESKTIMAAFPWLTEDILNEISNLYKMVCMGRATIEDVAAYIRSVEPIEPQATPEPSEAQHEALAVSQRVTRE